MRSLRIYSYLCRKEGEDYYETVNELGRRIELGLSSLYGSDRPSRQGKSTYVSACAEAIAADDRRKSGATTILRQPKESELRET